MSTSRRRVTPNRKAGAWQFSCVPGELPPEVAKFALFKTHLLCKTPAFMKNPHSSYRISQTLPVKNVEFTEEKARQHLFEQEILAGPFRRVCFGSCRQEVSSENARRRALSQEEVSIVLTGMCAACWEQTAIPENNMTYEQKLAKWRAGMARFPVPPVCTASWTESSWIKWVDQKGIWL